jgi:predicted DNA-binding WGR domain protein
MGAWDTPPTDFRFLLFERVNPEKNESRFYYLGWQPTLLDEGAVVRLFGRKNGAQRMLTPQPYASLEEAWPLLRAIIKTRLRHGYKIIQPPGYGQMYHHQVRK